MTALGTEGLHDQAKGLDTLPLTDAATILAEGQIAAAAVLRAAAPEIAAASGTLAKTMRAGGVIHYVAAGSSGLMAAADALELGGTFSIPSAQIRIHMAGGMPTGVELPGETEDDLSGLDERFSALSERDTVIAVSASGTTPYTLEAARLSRAAGATIVGIANNAGSALLDLADHPILLATPPEVLSGSTRMGAGTAQKIALNMLSTLMAIKLGHVHDGMMVNLRADNAKLRLRAAGMVSRIAGVDETAASAALDATQGHVKPAVLVSKGQTPETAQAILRETEGNLRAALGRLEHKDS
ncbi:N-acetylmuramic acid 6-phosphate etherase [Ruegeria aquimaris]|uniref:N-acetylmuramic acid 6-phosphate etherase n=1 Tax=Ruegeria aquimaris TaxID=2984333 RepID=A0ABT3AGL6_9RHOB|nr:N-acetylmuramic acid 6-phosphate etherase [Ruegeria sp. XHP0148]MCV2887773.1 N-acetylmuramic acid 6-phosphate etherase [Ruegeria sp. XHP0148]